MISYQTCAGSSFDLEITVMISDQTALHSVQLPSAINRRIVFFFHHQSIRSPQNPIMKEIRNQLKMRTMTEMRKKQMNQRNLYQAHQRQTWKELGLQIPPQQQMFQM